MKTSALMLAGIAAAHAACVVPVGDVNATLNPLPGVSVNASNYYTRRCEQVGYLAEPDVYMCNDDGTWDPYTALAGTACDEIDVAALDECLGAGVVHPSTGMSKLHVGQCGCQNDNTVWDGEAELDHPWELDSDWDGVADCVDACPFDNSKSTPREVRLSRCDCGETWDPKAKTCFKNFCTVPEGMFFVNPPAGSIVQVESYYVKVCPENGFEDEQFVHCITTDGGDALWNATEASAATECACETADAFDDGDGIPECCDVDSGICLDYCPMSDKVEPGMCGCDVEDTFDPLTGKAMCLSGNCYATSCPEATFEVLTGQVYGYGNELCAFVPSAEDEFNLEVSEDAGASFTVLSSTPITNMEEAIEALDQAMADNHCCNFDKGCQVPDIDFAYPPRGEYVPVDLYMVRKCPFDDVSFEAPFYYCLPDGNFHTLEEDGTYTMVDFDALAECNVEEDAEGMKVCYNDIAGGKIVPGYCGCGTPDIDYDGDGVYDCDGTVECGEDCGDQCPYNPDKISPGVCGCSMPESAGAGDADGDETPDCMDMCPQDADKILPGGCGCGVQDVDNDNDMTWDCHSDSCHLTGDASFIGSIYGFGSRLCSIGSPETTADENDNRNCPADCPRCVLRSEDGGETWTGLDYNLDSVVEGDGCPRDENGAVMQTDEALLHFLEDVYTFNNLCCGDMTCTVPVEDNVHPIGAHEMPMGQYYTKTCYGMAPEYVYCDGTLPSGWSHTPAACENEPEMCDDGSVKGICDCGTPDVDSDGDGKVDCIDLCPFDSRDIFVGTAGAVTQLYTEKLWLDNVTYDQTEEVTVENTCGCGESFVDGQCLFCAVPDAEYVSPAAGTKVPVGGYFVQTCPNTNTTIDPLASDKYGKDMYYCQDPVYTKCTVVGTWTSWYEKGQLHSDVCPVPSTPTCSQDFAAAAAESNDFWLETANAFSMASITGTVSLEDSLEGPDAPYDILMQGRAKPWDAVEVFNMPVSCEDWGKRAGAIYIATEAASVIIVSNGEACKFPDIPVNSPVAPLFVFPCADAVVSSALVNILAPKADVLEGTWNGCVDHDSVGPPMCNILD